MGNPNRYWRGRGSQMKAGGIRGFPPFPQKKAERMGHGDHWGTELLVLEIDQTSIFLIVKE
jgi:hypothetical protein